VQINILKTETMANFKDIHKRVMKIEAGYQCDPEDNGNYTGGKKGIGFLIGTKYGVSAPELCAYLGRVAMKEEMINLSRETADKIYIKNYWNQIRGDEINDAEVAFQIYDMAINAGVGTSIGMAQENVGLPVTRVMTTTTINKLNNKA
jgi:lysozyme family protein